MKFRISLSIDKKNPALVFVCCTYKMDLTVIEINESDAFCLISDYAQVSEEAEINAGLLQKLEIDTTPFEHVEKMEVSEC